MPVFQITAPDGKILRVTAPEGATQEDVLAHVQENYKPQAQQEQQPQLNQTYFPAYQRASFGVMEPIMGAGQLIGKGLEAVTSLGGLYPNPVSETYKKINEKKINTTIKNLENKYDYNRKLSGEDGIDWAKIAGNVASPINWIGGGASTPTTLGGKMAMGAGQGAIYGAATPVDDKNNFWGNKAEQLFGGAISGGVGGAAGAGIEKILSPKTLQSVKDLANEGVGLTIGQTLGGGFKRAEDALSSVPIVGDIIKSAQNRSIKDLNKAAYNRALKPIGESIPDNIMGHDAIEYIGNKLSDKYETLLPKMTGKLDDELQSKLSNVYDMVQSGLPEQEQKVFQSTMDRVLGSRVSPNGSITGQSLKEIESELGGAAKDFLNSSDAYQSQLGRAFKEVQSSLRDMLSRQNPDYAKELASINKGYANFKRVQKAASSVATNEGVFSPAQLQNAVKVLDKSKDKGSFAKGAALMQDLSSAAKEVLPQKLNDSGTASRLLMGAGLLGGAGIADQYNGGQLTPYLLGAGLLTGGLYSKKGSEIVNKILTERPDILRKVGSQAPDFMRYVSAPLGLAIKNSPAQ